MKVRSLKKTCKDLRIFYGNHLCRILFDFLTDTFVCNYASKLTANLSTHPGDDPK